MERKFTTTKALQHFKTIIIHKHEVFKACHQAGYTWTGLKHDLSKFHPIEFIESVKHKENGISPIDVAKSEKGYSEAWQHHKGVNPHHWEYWTSTYRTESVYAIKIPFKHLAEMFCDYIGAGKTYGRARGIEWTPVAAKEYWEALRDGNSVIHPESVEMLNLWFQSLIVFGLKDTLKNLKIYENLYNNNY